MVKSSEVVEYVTIVHAAMSTLNKKLQLQKTQMKKRAKTARASKRTPSQRVGASNMGKKQGYNSANNRISLGTGSSGSSFATNRRQQVVEEDEYVGEINGSVGFSNTAYAVNPGQAVTFPWGSKIASLYNEYEFQYLEFYYKREVSEFSSNGQAGKVILSFNYDATDLPPSTKQQVEDTLTKVDGMPCTPCLRLPINATVMRKNDAKYVRPGPQVANTDLKTYDVGVLNVSTYGNTNTTIVGELHVRYKCTLRVPILDPSQQVGGVVHFSGTLPTSADNFATAILQAGGTVDMQTITVASNVITFPAGIPANYLVSMNILASTSATAFGITPTAGAVTVKYFTSTTRNNSSQAASIASTAGASAMFSATYAVGTSGGVLTISPSTIVGGIGMDLWITSLPSTVLTLVKVNELKTEVDDLKYQMSQLRTMISSSHLSDDEFVDSDKSISYNEEKKCAEIDKSQYISRSVVKALLGK